MMGRSESTKKSNLRSGQRRKDTFAENTLLSIFLDCADVGRPYFGRHVSSLLTYAHVPPYVVVASLPLLLSATFPRKNVHC